jgi:hypothetical protein
MRFEETYSLWSWGHSIMSVPDLLASGKKLLKLLPQHVPSHSAVLSSMTDATDGFPSPRPAHFPLYSLLSERCTNKIRSSFLVR